MEFCFTVNLNCDENSCFLQLDNDGPQLHGLYSFAVITQEEEMLLAANSEEEKYK